MAPTGKSRVNIKDFMQAQVPFNAKVGADFDRLRNQMAHPLFFEKYNGPMAFYNAPENAYWKSLYTQKSWPNGWNAAKKKNTEEMMVPTAGADPMAEDGKFIVLDISRAMVTFQVLLYFLTITFALLRADDDEEEDNQLFSPGPSSSLFKRAHSSGGPGEPTAISEGFVTLKTDCALQLARNEKWCVTPHWAQVLTGHDQTMILQLTVIPNSGAVPITLVPDLEDVENEKEKYVMEGNFSRVKFSVEDGRNGESIFVFKQPVSKLNLRTVWKKKTIQATKTGDDLENWTRGMVQFENDVAKYQEKTNAPVYSVSHFTLPFKCVKKIEEEGILPLFDPDDGSCGITFQLWHADQSGRENVPIKKGCTIMK